MIHCPQCGCEIQPSWDWCHGCGFDPEGLKPPGWHEPRAADPPDAPSRQGGAFGTFLKIVGAISIVFVVLIGILVTTFVVRVRNATDPLASVDAVVVNPVAGGLDAASTTSITTPWQTYTTPDGSTSIDFPGVPTDQPTGSPSDALTNEHRVVWDQDGASYTFASFDVVFGGVYPDPPAALKGLADSTTAGMKMTETSRASTSFAGLPAVVFNGRADLGQPVDVRGMMAVAGPRIYLLVVTSQAGSDADWDHFVNSWHVN